MLTLGKELASAVLQLLTETEVKRLSRAFMSVSEVDRETQLSVAREFRHLINARDTMLIDGKGFARDVINGAFGDKGGEGMLEYVNGSTKEPISSIVSTVSTKVLSGFVQAEHPQTIAFLFSKMEPSQAAGLFSALDENAQTDIVIRIAGLNRVNNNVVDEVREVLRSQLRGSGTEEEEIGGPKAAADMLNFFERTSEERIMAEVEEMYPDLADQIRNLMFTFEDCKKIDDKGVQSVLKEVPRDQLVLSLKTASEDLRDLILRNVSQRAAAMILDDLSALGPVKVKDVEKAQQGVVDIVRRLEAEGKIAIGGGANAEDRMV